MHYFIILVIITIIVYLQIKRYKDTLGKIKTFKNIFAQKKDSYTYGNQHQIEKSVSNANDEELMMMLKTAGINVEEFYCVQNDEEGKEFFVFDSSSAKRFLLDHGSSTKGISSSHRNPVFTEIINAINSYLSNNKGSVSDFHLMKDIVDRNCDAKEEEINAQIPVPLYLGLMGTMVGILVGIGYLWFSGDLAALLNSGDGKSGADGVEALLGGVALAMISSILGILLTTSGSMKAKDARSEEEKNKHIFLSWMQATLLPNLSNDTAQTLERMSANLIDFNRTFSSNTRELGTTLQQVNEATKLQKQLLEAVEKLADKNVSKQNLDLYNALRNSSQEIATLGGFLRDSNQYLAQVRELNDRLDRNENRTKAIEEMAEFFKSEVGQIEQRKEAINKAVGEVDSRLEETFRKLTDDTNGNIDAFQKALGKQQDVLQQKLNETQVIVDELKNLSSIKDNISKFEKATAEQNRKIDRLTESIRSLVESSTEGRNQIASGQFETRNNVRKKMAIIGSVSLAILVIMALVIANWDSIYSFLLDFLRF